MKEDFNLPIVAWAVAGEALVERCRKMGSLQQKMIRFWSMAVDDATVHSQQIPQESPHRRVLKANVNDTCETLISDMLKTVHEACETLEATNSALEKEALDAAMESKVTLAVTTIRNKIQVSSFLLICYK